MKTYLRFFKTEKEALRWMRWRNAAAQRAGNNSDVLVVTNGPEDNWAVMDLDSAIELGAGYYFGGRVNTRFGMEVA